jgi:hypothetical protein
MSAYEIELFNWGFWAGSMVGMFFMLAVFGRFHK